MMEGRARWLLQGLMSDADVEASLQELREIARAQSPLTENEDFALWEREMLTDVPQDAIEYMEGE